MQIDIIIFFSIKVYLSISSLLI